VAPSCSRTDRMMAAPLFDAASRRSIKRCMSGRKSAPPEIASAAKPARRRAVSTSVR
jgi:hypothetical protein